MILRRTVRFRGLLQLVLLLKCVARCASASASSSTVAVSSISKTAAAARAAHAATAAAPNNSPRTLLDAATSQTLGGVFKNAVQNQEETTQYRTEKTHKHRAFLQKPWEGFNANSAAQSRAQKSTQQYSFWYYARVGLAGGIAGATGTGLLFPMDSAKTLRQSQPAQYASVRQALTDLCVTKTGTKSTWHLQRAYTGWGPAVAGAIPSSALYFGAYESMKRFITMRTTDGVTPPCNRMHRLGIHAAAAASGNVLSSLVFVPKELVKQQMQFQGTGSTFGQVMLKILRRSGVRGLYTGYQATLMRNIPSAMLRFVLYEELKWAWYTSPDSRAQYGVGELPQLSWKLFAIGGMAGSLASGIVTPIDVVKTRLSTGQCPIDVGSCVQHVLSEQGWAGLYAGAGSRMVWSGAFSAIGFGSFEAAKTWLGVSDTAGADKASQAPKASRIPKLGRLPTDRQRRLEHALSDAYEDEEVELLQ